MSNVSMYFDYDYAFFDWGFAIEVTGIPFALDLIDYQNEF